MLTIDKQLLQRFEAGLIPQQPAASAVPAEIVGYGEISAIFRIEGDDQNVYKRLPIFEDRQAAEQYRNMHDEYCGLLENAGLRLPAHATHIVTVPGRPVAVYIAQQRFAGDRLCHRQILRLDDSGSLMLIERVAAQIAKVWAFNAKSAPETELAIDGQLSNWVATGGDMTAPQALVYIDTSTPLLRKNGVEQQNPERLLKSAPGFLRWIIRWFFLGDVMSRYYSPRLVYTDLAANLYKEQRPELVPSTVAIVNRFLGDGEAPLTEREIERYYAQDKLIWTVFLSFRRIDRWIKTRLLRQRYEFILPGAIKR